MNDLRSEGMKVSGPPTSIIGARNSQPWARIDTVCTVTARKIEAAISLFAAFLAMRFCMSVLQNTPQREAMA